MSEGQGIRKSILDLEVLLGQSWNFFPVSLGGNLSDAFKRIGKPKNLQTITGRVVNAVSWRGRDASRKEQRQAYASEQTVELGI